MKLHPGDIIRYTDKNERVMRRLIREVKGTVLHTTILECPWASHWEGQEDMMDEEYVPSSPWKLEESSRVTQLLDKYEGI